jgi:hypothetical protein
VDQGLELVVQVVVEKRDGLPELGVSFNGSWPSFENVATSELLFPNRPATHHLPEYRAYNTVFGVDAIREGWNEVVLYNGSHQRSTEQERLANAVTVVSVELGVR